MTLDLDKFLDQLAKWFVTRAAAISPAVTLKYETTPRDLWVHSATETVGCADVYSIFSVYGGGRSDLAGENRIPVQIMTFAGDPGAALTRASFLHGLFFDQTTKKPLLNVDLTDFKFLGPVNLRPPGMTGRDDKDRWTAVSNFDAVIVAKT